MSTTPYQKRVLVVDDAPFFRMILQDLLEEDGHHVETAENGAAAMTVLAEKSFDLMILDLNMPELTGYEVLRQLQEYRQGRHRDLRILVLTGEHVPVLDMRVMRNSGVEGFICKSDPPDFTLNRIRKALF